MRQFYSLPTATYWANVPATVHAAMPCPDVPTLTVVIVHNWPEHAVQDAWEALPGVAEHYPEHLGLPAPAGVIAAFASWGATTGMTLRQVFGLIRKQWPMWRH